MTEQNYKELGALRYICKLMDKYPTATNIILVLEAVALFWAVLTYNFTTNI